MFPWGREANLGLDPSTVDHGRLPCDLEPQNWRHSVAYWNPLVFS